MKVRLLHDASVRHSQGEILEVSEKEAARLIAFRNAEAVEETAEKAEKPAGKAGKKSKKAPAK